MKHLPDCKMAFGRKDPNCPRCQELLNGDAPIKAWGFAKRLEEQRTLAAIRSHDFAACARQNIVCTHFDS